MSAQERELEDGKRNKEMGEDSLMAKAAEAYKVNQNARMGTLVFLNDGDHDAPTKSMLKVQKDQKRAAKKYAKMVQAALQR